MKEFSEFAGRITTDSGISLLMEDLGEALAKNQNTIMLGGGNPAHIPEIQKHFRQAVKNVLDSPGRFEKVIGDYDPPCGNIDFINAVCKLLKNEFGWKIKPRNIVLTTGSQSAFFLLFNLFAGRFENGEKKQILLPLTPEYIGYCDVGLIDNFFSTNKPKIEYIDEHTFKYHIDFEKINVTDSTGAICVSRPTNPTGNVLTDEEICKLSDIALKYDIPLIIDNAYGTPFPNIIFTDVQPIWNENTVVCLSLSKLGLPATRTGIVIAREDIARMLAKANAVINLAPGGLGAAIATDMVRTGQITRLSSRIIKPFYKGKADFAAGLIRQKLKGLDYYIHLPQGSIFLWLWFKALPITSAELYERLKKEKVLIVPGHYFFPGINDNWPHKFECIRINHSGDEKTVARGIEIIADQVRKAYNSD